VAKKKELTSGNITSRKWLFNIILFACLFVVIIALFHEFVFSDEMLYGSDTIQAGVFFRSFYVDYVNEFGKVPVWNPYQFCGIPYIDGFHGDTYYPFSTLKFFINIYRALGWNLILHVFLAGITMFACARVFKRSQMGAALAAVSYMFAAYFVSQVAPGHDGKMFVTALFPLTIMLIELAFEKRMLMNFALLGLTIGIIILTPHPQMAYYVLWACAGYFVFKLIFYFLEKRSFTVLVKPVSLFVVAVVIGLAISAIHFYPGYTYVKKYSPRSDAKRGMDWAKSWSLHPEEAVSLIMPEFCGSSGEGGNTYWGRNYFKDNSEYAGVVPLMLAIVAVVMLRRRKTWFFMGMALFALIYALAGDTFFFYIFYYIIPNVKSTRAWSMIMFMFSFSVALLAAFGLDFIIEQSRKIKGQERRLLALSLYALPGIALLGALFFSLAPESAAGLYKSVFYSSITSQKAMVLQNYLGDISTGFWITFLFLIIPALIVWFYIRRQLPVLALGLVIVFALVDSFRFDERFITTISQDRLFSSTPVDQYFKSQSGKFRVVNLTRDSRILPYNHLPMFGVEEMTSYHGNQPRWYDNLLGGTALRNMTNRNLMDMTNTRYVLISPATGISPEQMEGAGFPFLTQLGRVSIHENQQANDRAIIVHDWVVEPDTTKLQELILSAEFNPAKQVGLFAEPPIEKLSDTAAVSDSVIINEYLNDYISLTTITDQPGILVLADNWYPAWKGFVDGNEVPVLMANAAFRGVPLSAGEHKVEFKYISETQRTGRILTWSALILVAGMVGADIVIRRKKKLQADGK